MQWSDRISRAVQRVDTPCYVTAFAPVQHALARLDSLRSPVPIQSWLSYKTHPLPALAQAWIQSGRGVEVVSSAELETLIELGCPIDQLLVNGVAKHTWLGRHPIDRLRVHFDSAHEIDALLPMACKYRWRVGVRVHPPDEHDAREPGFGGQFGFVGAEAVRAFRRLADAGADLQSAHFHLGQGRHVPLAVARAVAHVADICEQAGVSPRYLDCGGGLPSFDDPEVDAALAGIEKALVVAAARYRNLREVWLENGRFVTGAAAALAVRVVDVKDRHECRYIICDGGRTNHALAADTHVHPIAVLPPRYGAARLTTVCGPTCMTDDRLGRWMLPDTVAVGDTFVWFNAGAYHLPWETRFSHGLCAVVWFDGDERMSVARSREQPRRAVLA